MLFKSKQIKGEGRGHSVGFPTINLIITEELVLDEGIYAVWVDIGGRVYKGALHYGSIPTFDLKEPTLEVHLIDLTDDTVPETENVDIELDFVKRIREVKKFEDAEELSIQIVKDIKVINNILS